MNLSALLETIEALPEVGALVEAVAEARATPSALRVPRSARPALAAALATRLAQPVVYLVTRTDRELVVQEELGAWNRTLPMLPFPEPNPLFYDCAPWGPRTIRLRAAVLADLTSGAQPGGPAAKRAQGSVLVTTARAVMTRTLPPRIFVGHSRWLHAGSELRFDRVLALLHDAGYARETLVTEPGRYSQRGGLIDIWPPSEPHPVRLEFEADTLESMRSFDQATQRSRLGIEWLRLTPAREGLPRFHRTEWDRLLPADLQGDPLELRDARLEYFLPWMHDVPSGLLDYLPEGAPVVFDDRAAVEEMITEMEEQALGLRAEQEAAGQLPSEAPAPYLGLAEITDALPAGRVLDFGYLQSNEAPAMELGDRFSAAPRFGGQVRQIIDFIAERQAVDEQAVIVSRQAPRVAELWSERGQPAAATESLGPEFEAGLPAFVTGALTDGWSLASPGRPRLHLLTDAELFGWGRPRPRLRLREAAAAPEAMFADLRPGDLVVHVDFGIGRFSGLVERTVDDIRREFDPAAGRRRVLFNFEIGGI